MLLLTSAALAAALLTAPRGPRPGGRYDLAA